jgi:DNA ligase-1
LKRREELASLFSGIDQSIEKKRGLALSRMQVVEDPEEGYEFFDSALRDGCEGIMAKSVSRDSIYQAGSRGWLWIKYKQDYRTELSDTLDLVVVGAFHGTGRRKGTYGALLMATIDEGNVFRTVCKLGSGFNDEHLAVLVDEINAMKGPKDMVWKNVDSRMEPDICVSPELVLEVLAAEITFSPVHTCSFGKMKENAGLALRFPRFTGRFRRDKGPMDATTEREVRSLYSSQRKIISEKDPS